MSEPRKRIRIPKTFPCASCGAPRPQGGSISKPGSVCKKCRKEKFGKLTWQHATDTREAKAERAKRTWKEPAERPSVTGLASGTQTKWGTVQARGMNDKGRYYLVVDERGVVAQVPAAQVEGVA